MIFLFDSTETAEKAEIALKQAGFKIKRVTEIENLPTQIIWEKEVKDDYETE